MRQCLPALALALSATTAGCALDIRDADPSEEPFVADEVAPLQHQNANAHQWWNLPTSAWNVDQKIVVDAISNATYFATTVGFQNVSGGAYMGFQQLGDGKRIARFSVWDATSFQAGPGASCRSFGGEGVGQTCELPYGFATKRWYTYRMWRLSRSSSGTWWGAWIIDDQGKEAHIGNIKAPPAAGDISWVDSFDEYWGTAKPCSSVPYSSAWFLAPRLNGGQAWASFGTTSTGTCSGGRVTPTVYGTSRLELGRYW